jgi:Tfp pilus assembly protein PilO
VAARKDIHANPYASLIPWGCAAALLALTLAGAHYGVVAPAQERLTALEAKWAAARQSLAHRQEARQARQDLARVLAFLPEGREFARLPLVISEIAQRDRVAIPSFTYTVDKSEDGPAAKATLQGTATGQYEDLRRFIHHLEASDRLLLFIEDLSVGQSTDVKAEHKGQKVTVNLRLATYIREDARPGRGLKASLE